MGYNPHEARDKNGKWTSGGAILPAPRLTGSARAQRTSGKVRAETRKEAHYYSLPDGSYGATDKTAGFVVRGKAARAERLSGDKARDTKTLLGRIAKGEAAEAKAGERHKDANFLNKQYVNSYNRVHSNRGTTEGEAKLISAADAARLRLGVLDSRKGVGGKTIAQQAATSAGKRAYTSRVAKKKK